MNTSPAPRAARHRAGPPPARHPAPEVGSWLQGFLAFLLHLAGLLANDPTPQGRQAARALRDLQDLIARESRARLDSTRLESARPTPRYRHAHHRPRVPRLPRVQRRIILTPGIYAALYFTPRAAIAARARFATSAGRVASALQARTNRPFSILSRSAATPTHAHFIS